jgi:hypothetical protein
LAWRPGGKLCSIPVLVDVYEPPEIVNLRVCMRCMQCGQAAIGNAARGECPQGKFAAPLPWRPRLLSDPAPPKAGGCCGADGKVWGPPLWTEIHARPELPFDVERERAFFAGLPARIPCCDCKAHLIEYTAANPIPLSDRDPEKLRAWAVEFHDEINVRLGRPRWASAATASP